MKESRDFPRPGTLYAYTLSPTSRRRAWCTAGGRAPRWRASPCSSTGGTACERCSASAPSRAAAACCGAPMGSQGSCTTPKAPRSAEGRRGDHVFESIRIGAPFACISMCIILPHISGMVSVDIVSGLLAPGDSCGRGLPPTVYRMRPGRRTPSRSRPRLRLRSPAAPPPATTRTLSLPRRRTGSCGKSTRMMITFAPRWGNAPPRRRIFCWVEAPGSLLQARRLPTRTLLLRGNQITPEALPPRPPSSSSSREGAEGVYFHEWGSAACWGLIITGEAAARHR